MDTSPTYWKMCLLSLAGEIGYEYRLVPLAQEFFHKQFLVRDALNKLPNPPNYQNRDIQAALLSQFHTKNSAVCHECL